MAGLTYARICEMMIVRTEQKMKQKEITNS